MGWCDTTTDTLGRGTAFGNTVQPFWTDRRHTKGVRNTPKWAVLVVLRSLQPLESEEAETTELWWVRPGGDQ